MASPPLTTTIEEFNNKELLDRIRPLLQRDKIRLWEAPYTDADTGAENIPDELIESICAEVGCTIEQTRLALSYLRRHALEKLASKKRTDLITLKIRSSGVSKNKNDCINISISCQSNGHELEKLIQEKLNLHDQNLKMICSGRMIQLNESLQKQNIHTNTTILVLAVPKSAIASASADVQTSNLIQAVKEATKILHDNARNAVNSSQYQLRITDQQGRELTALSDDERRSLMIAMTLHEKGRSFLRQRDYLSALSLFSEADNEFRQCSSQMLNSVDNWGLLNLDIVWCYLCMQNVNDLQDAAERLMRCDTCFVKVYGNSFQRLNALQKDGKGHMVLFVRLHLLQAIVAYHAGRKIDAKNLLGMAEEEARMMHVDPEKLTQIMLMGYTVTEARRGLRSSQGNIDQAVEFIIENRRVREERLREERAREEEERLQNRYGHTQNGQKINITYLRQLESMGYPRRACAEALKQANNRLEEASEMLLTNIDTLVTVSRLSADDHNDDDGGASSNQEGELIDDGTLIPQLVALGAEPEQARALLEIHDNRLDRAAEELLQKFRNPIGTTTDDQMSNLFERARKIVEKRAAKRARLDEKAAADEHNRTTLETIVPDLLRGNRQLEDINGDSGPDDYLDLLLDEEETFIREYRHKLINDGVID
ncbi:unnamed protein product [Rotaria sp. Silwood1]|nr:unnamed protein product [Rotaria sp. Silwood1]CAF3387181.1 unnamed protein product [Rotaria sp. Silwood1]CAF3429856.1 unnamed protein product [Rotaria sp. Silwood1]CAF4495859.1 unnamed protein product [Rotaria sp. Silwood1]CAF4532605.1 unnamed protein product [Rotaria sp. Silwood1]